MRLRTIFLLIGWATLLGLDAFGVPAQTLVTDELFKTGKIRFVPLITITDEAMGGKAVFSRPTDVAVDGQGRVFVSDAKESAIRVFDAAGAYLKTIGRAGQGPGEFGSYLLEIEYSGDRLYAHAMGSVSVFDSKGVFVDSVKQGRPLWQIFRALPDGRFIVQKNITDYQSPDHKVELRLDLHSAELIYIKTIYKRDIRRYKPITKPVAIDLSLPFIADVSWDILPEGKIVIGYSASYQIEIHDPDKGKLASFSRTYDPVAVTREDERIFHAGVSYMTQDGGGPPALHKGAADYMIENTEFPKFKPPFTRLLVDAQGRIWVRLSEPAAEMEAPRFDIFDGTGRFLGKILVRDGVFPNRMLPWAGGFWAVKATEDDEFSIIKYGLEAVR